MPCGVAWVASTCSSIGCQSAVYFTSKRLTVDVERRTEERRGRDDPRRCRRGTTRTRSIPTREPGDEERELRGAFERLHRPAGSGRLRPGSLWRPGAQRYNGGTTASAQDISARPITALRRLTGLYRRVALIAHDTGILDQYRALREGAGLVDRSDRGRLLLTGADRRAYLQGLLTNDIAALSHGHRLLCGLPDRAGPHDRGHAHLRDGGLAPRRSRRRGRAWCLRPLVAVHLQRGRHDSRTWLNPPRSSACTVRARRQVLESALAAGRLPGEPTPSAPLLDSMPLYANSRWNFGAAPVFVLRSDDVGVMGFDIVVTSDRRKELAEPADRRGRRRRRGRGGARVPRRSRTAAVSRRHDRRHDPARGRHRGSRDQPDEGLLRRAGDHHPRPASRARPCRAAPGRARVRSVAAVPARGDKIRHGDRDVGSITSAVQSPALGRPIALGYVHRDFVEPGTCARRRRGRGHRVRSAVRLKMESKVRKL